MFHLSRDQSNKHISKKLKVEVYCFFLQVRHKFELTFLEVLAKDK